MSEIRSALVWERGNVGVSGLTVTLQEVEVQGKCMVMALVCEGKGEDCPLQLPAGYFAESMVGWFHNELLPVCQRTTVISLAQLEQMLQMQCEKTMAEWRGYASKHNCSGEIRISGIVLWNQLFVAFGNEPVCVLNRRFNRPRKKKLLPGGEEIMYAGGEVQGLLSFYLENISMRELAEEEEILECLYTEKLLEEKKLEKRLGELGKVTWARDMEKSVGAVILEVKVC